MSGNRDKKVHRAVAEASSENNENASESFHSFGAHKAGIKERSSSSQTYHVRGDIAPHHLDPHDEMKDGTAHEGQDGVDGPFVRHC